MTPIRLLALGALALTLSACVSLFPKSEPAQLYRLNPVIEGTPSTSVRPVGVLMANGSFVRASAGDRILAVTGGEAAYIAEARWASPATVLFDEAVLRAFDVNPGPARLVGRGDPARSAYILRLDVRDFHADYRNGQEAAPQVVVRVRAELIHGQTREVAGEQIIEAVVPAGDNRVSAIVRAFDQATAQVLTRLVAWTNERVG